MSIRSLKAVLTCIAENHPVDKSRNIRKFKTFNDTLKKHFKYIGRGAFRLAFQAQDDQGKQVVIKVIANSPKNNVDALVDITDRCLAANRHEYDYYKQIAKNYPNIAKFLLKPIAFIKVAGHQVLVFPKVRMLPVYKKGIYTKWQEDCLGFMSTVFFDLDDDRNMGFLEDVEHPIVFDYNINLDGKPCTIDIRDPEQAAKDLLAKKSIRSYYKVHSSII